MSEYTHEVKRVEDARVHLTITVPNTIVKNIYQENLKDIGQKAQIKGFRKGKVPFNVLEQKFGEALRADATEKVIQEAMKNTLEKVEEKPLGYSYPTLENMDDNEENLLVNPEMDFTFTISYDTEPKIQQADVASLELTKYKVQVNEADIQSELQSIQERNAITVDKTGAASDGDVLTYSYVEIDENNTEIADSKRESYTSTIGENTNIYDIDEDLKGMKKDEEKIAKKKYPDDYQHSDLAGREIQLKITVERVRQKELPDIDDDLAQDVNEKYKTLEDLKTHLRNQLESRAQYMIEDIQKERILEYLREHSEIEVPRSAVDVQLNASWRQFIQQYGGDEQMILKSLEQSGTAKETLMDAWRDDARKQVINQLLINKLTQELEIQFDHEDVKARLKEDSEKMGQDFEEVLKYYSDKNLMDDLKYDMEQKKVFEKLEELSKVKEEKEFSFSELLDYKQQLDKERLEKSEAKENADK